jgi:mono/diheme cytochrome c family protein
MRTSRLLACLAAALGACTEGPPTGGFAEPQTLGGQRVAAELLTQGQRAYAVYCRACHGDHGDGRGPAAPGLRPPPRDFTLGVFKFAAVPGGALPNDDDLRRIVRSGLHGTAMRAWDVPAPELEAIIQYLKTFSPRWREEAPGEPILPTPDPWRGREAEGAARGRDLYHGLAQCTACHPAHLSRRQIVEATRRLSGAVAGDFRDDMYGPAAKKSDYGVLILPPDFTRAALRSVREGHRREDLYRVIASGVGGTAMPTWRGSLPEEDLWALVHYVEGLTALKGTDEPRRRLEANLADDQAEAGRQEPARAAPKR